MDCTSLGSVSLSTSSAGGLSADGNLDDSGVGWVGDPSQNQLIRLHGHLGVTAEDSGAEEAVDSEAATGEGSEVDLAGGVEEEDSAIGAEAGAGVGSVGDEAGAGADSVVADLVGEVRPVEEASVPVTMATGAGVVDRLEASVVEVEDSGTSCSVLYLPISRLHFPGDHSSIDRRGPEKQPVWAMHFTSLVQRKFTLLGPVDSNRALLATAESPIAFPMWRCCPHDLRRKRVCEPAQWYLLLVSTDLR